MCEQGGFGEFVLTALKSLFGFSVPGDGRSVVALISGNEFLQRRLVMRGLRRKHSEIIGSRQAGLFNTGAPSGV